MTPVGFLEKKKNNTYIHTQTHIHRELISGLIPGHSAYGETLTLISHRVHGDLEPMGVFSLGPETSLNLVTD